MPAGEPVLLLHGQPGSGRDWDRVRRAIGDRARTIPFDRPGWDGRSAPASLAGNAEAALAALDRAGARRATVVGHSFGAAVAAWLAVDHPHRVAALVLVAPAASVASLLPLDRLLATPVVGDVVGSAALATAGAVLAAAPLRGLVARGLSVDERYLSAAGRILIRPSTWRAFAAEQRMLVRDLPALESRLGNIAAPTTIAIGTADVIVPPSSARELALRIPAAELVELERATHLLPQLHARWLVDVILDAAGRSRAAG
jgi:pimeloyl-ACP methyl ester carboxylesterase